MEMKNLDFKDYIDNDQFVKEFETRGVENADYITSIGQYSYNYWDLNTSMKSHILLTKLASEFFNKDLIPTYTDSRKYLKGSRLYFHTDRVECEYSLTYTVRGNIPWTIYVGDEKIETTTGIGIFYKGIEQLHGRIGKCQEDVYCCFFHWVDKNGEYSNYAFDKIKFPDFKNEEKYEKLSQELGVTL